MNEPFQPSVHTMSRFTHLLQPSMIVENPGEDTHLEVDQNITVSLPEEAFDTSYHGRPVWLPDCRGKNRKR